MPSRLYADALAAARRRSAALSVAAQRDMVKLYAALLVRIIQDGATGRITASRAEGISRSIRSNLERYGVRWADVMDRAAIGSATFAASGHAQALKDIAASTGARLVDQSFVEVPSLALERMIVRRELAERYGLTGFSGLFKTVASRNMTKAAGAIDEVLAIAVGQGMDTRDTTRVIARILAGNETENVRDLLKVLGPRGGFLRRSGITGDVARNILNSGDYKRARGLLRDGRRIAVHETNSAFDEADKFAAHESLLIAGHKWTLSGRHGSTGSAPDRCFPAGTPIATDRGPKPIESIRVGDRVLTHRSVYRTVDHVWVNPPKQILYRVTAVNEYGQRFQVTATHNHPFLTPQGWTDASDLKTGSHVALQTGWPVAPPSQPRHDMDDTTPRCSHRNGRVPPVGICVSESHGGSGGSPSSVLTHTGSIAQSWPQRGSEASSRPSILTNLVFRGPNWGFDHPAWIETVFSGAQEMPSAFLDDSHGWGFPHRASDAGSLSPYTLVSSIGCSRGVDHRLDIRPRLSFARTSAASQASQRGLVRTGISCCTPFGSRTCDASPYPILVSSLRSEHTASERSGAFALTRHRRGRSTFFGSPRGHRRSHPASDPSAYCKPGTSSFGQGLVISVDVVLSTTDSVYNISVENDHTYVAGGFAVHNCDYYATHDWYGLGDGVFPTDYVPPLPHPSCLCTTKRLLRSPSEWNKPKPDPPRLTPLDNEEAIDIAKAAATRQSVVHPGTKAFDARALRERRESIRVMRAIDGRGVAAPVASTPASFVAAVSKREALGRLEAFTRTIPEGATRGFDPPAPFDDRIPMATLNDILEGIETTFRLGSIKVTRIGISKDRKRYAGRYTQWFDGIDSIMFRKSALSKKHQTRTRTVFEHNKAHYIAQADRLLAREGLPDQAYKGARDTKAKWAATKRWTISQDHPRPVLALSKHEAYHAVYFQKRLGPIWEDEYRKFVKDLGKESRDAVLGVSEYAGSNIKELWSELGTAIDLGFDVHPRLKEAFFNTLKRGGLT